MPRSEKNLPVGPSEAWKGAQPTVTRHLRESRKYQRSLEILREEEILTSGFIF